MGFYFSCVWGADCIHLTEQLHQLKKKKLLLCNEIFAQRIGKRSERDIPGLLASPAKCLWVLYQWARAGREMITPPNSSFHPTTKLLAKFSYSLHLPLKVWRVLHPGHKTKGQIKSLWPRGVSSRARDITVFSWLPSATAREGNSCWSPNSQSPPRPSHGKGQKQQHIPALLFSQNQE